MSDRNSSGTSTTSPPSSAPHCAARRFQRNNHGQACFTRMIADKLPGAARQHRDSLDQKPHRFPRRSGGPAHFVIPRASMTPAIIVHVVQFVKYVRLCQSHSHLYTPPAARSARAGEPSANNTHSLEHRRPHRPRPRCRRAAHARAGARARYPRAGTMPVLYVAFSNTKMSLNAGRREEVNWVGVRGVGCSGVSPFTGTHSGVRHWGRAGRDCNSEVDSRCEPLAHLGETKGEVRLRQLRDHVPFERLVVRDRGLAVGRAEKDREGELCRSGPSIPSRNRSESAGRRRATRSD